MGLCNFSQSKKINLTFQIKSEKTGDMCKISQEIFLYVEDSMGHGGRSLSLSRTSAAGLPSVSKISKKLTTFFHSAKGTWTHTRRAQVANQTLILGWKKSVRGFSAPYALASFQLSSYRVTRQWLIHSPLLRWWKRGQRWQSKRHGTTPEPQPPSLGGAW